jgi:hypothetical protein
LSPTEDINAPYREIVRDFVSRKNRPWLLLAAGFVLVVAAWKFKVGEPRHRREPDTISYHYQQWLHHRRYGRLGSNRKGLNLQTVNWYLDGKPTVWERREAEEQHELALIRLGYFEERDFEWPGGDINKFFSNFWQRARQTDLKENYSARWSSPFAGNTNVSIVARKEDMPIVDSLRKELMRSATNESSRVQR